MAEIQILNETVTLICTLVGIASIAFAILKSVYNQRNQGKKLKILKGEWYTYHFSKDDEGSCLVRGRMYIMTKYPGRKLVNRFKTVALIPCEKGKSIDVDGVKEKKTNVYYGGASKDEGTLLIRLSSQFNSKDEIVDLRFKKIVHHHTPEKIYGIALSHDFVSAPRAMGIVISKNELDAETLKDIMQNRYSFEDTHANMAIRQTD